MGAHRGGLLPVEDTRATPMSILSRRVGLGLALAAVATMAVAFYLVTSRTQSVHDDTCTALMAIASDAEKMSYVRTWLAARVNDEKFMDALRKNRTFDRNLPATREYIDLDWRYLGFLPQYAWLGFELEEAGKEGPDAGGIASMSLNQFRSSIVIKVSAAGDLGFQWTPEEQKRVRSVGNDIFVYCEY